MANITVKNLVNYNLCEEMDSVSFVIDLAGEEISLRGGMCVASDGETYGGCSDVIIDFPQKFDPIKIIRKR